MAKLSQLMNQDKAESKREFIATAKSIAAASEDFTRMAKELARECTDESTRTVSHLRDFV